MNDTCGCCEGVQQLTPASIANRPGLNALAYRVGIHATFLETMRARLSSLSIPLGELGPLLGPTDDPKQPVYPLKALTTRSLDDPAIAFLDAWATVADVFTFYQERIANEGYLRTATERRSILELARLVGYTLRPGVASSTFLAYSLDNTQKVTTIPAGSRAQSIPGPGQKPQSFETSVDIEAHAAWNNLQPRMSIPQYITQLGSVAIDTDTTDSSIYLAGTSTNLKKGDPVLFVFGDKAGKQVFAHIKNVDPHAAEKYTRITFPTEFTPLVFLRNVLQLVEHYLDLASFGISKDEPGVSEVLPVLELVKAALELGEQYLELLAAGLPPSNLLKEMGFSLLIIGVLVLWLEFLLELLTTAVSPANAESAIIQMLIDIKNALDQGLQQGQLTNPDVITLLKAVQAALGQFLEQVTNPDLHPLLNIALAALNQFKQQTTNADIKTLLQDIQDALNPFTQQAGSPKLVDVLKAVQLKLDAFQTTNTDLKNLLSAVNLVIMTTPDLVSVLKALQSALNQIQPSVTDADVISMVQAVQTLLGQLLQAIRPEVDSLLEAIQQALDQFLLTFANLFTDNPSVAQTLMQAQDRRQKLGGMLLSIPLHSPVLQRFMSMTNQPHNLAGLVETDLARPMAAFLSTRGGIFPPNPIVETLTAWCSIYDSAVQHKSAKVATWTGGLISDIKSLVSTLPNVTGLGNIGISSTRVSQTTLDDVCVPTVTTNLATLVSARGLAAPGMPQPANSTRLKRSLSSTFSRKGDIAPQLLSVLKPEIASTLYDAYGNAQVTSPPPLKNLYAMRVKAAPFGSNAQQQATSVRGPDHETVVTTVTNPPNPPVTTTKTIQISETFSTQYTEWPLAPTDLNASTVLYLDAPYDHIVPESWVVIEYVPPVGLSNVDVQIPSLQMLKVKSVDALSRADYGALPKVTRLTLYDPWFTPGTTSTLGPFRGVTVYAQSEDLPLADQPITDDIGGSDIELDGLYDGLQSGRWVVVSGERTDIQNTSGVNTSELAMLAGVTQDVRQANPTVHITTPSDGQSGEPAQSFAPRTLPVALPGDKIHTTIHLATPLAHTYKRDTVTIAGNVVHATQGETKVQVLGSGDGSQSMQQFALSQSPLTYLSAPTPAGAESTLQVRVNDILWHETNSLEGLGLTDRGYITTADDQDKVRVTFGNGVHGARLPSGIENVKAVYRTGIGKPGNVDVGKISLLLTKPLGVKSVVNPLPATGGADRENRDQARKNVPLGVMSLDRIVSVQDYADFARTYAGIGKASAVSLPLGRQQVVYLTIAGLDNIPIDTTSDLYRNLLQSLRLFGNPSTPLQVALCEVKLLVITAKVRVLPDYLFDKVAPNIRSALYNAFSFEQRELGQTVFQSEVLSIMQRVPGVEYIELDILDAVEQAKLLTALDTIHQEELQEANSGKKGDEAADLAALLGLRKHSFVRAHPARPHTGQQGGISPAQIAFLSSDVPDTFILTELTTTHFTPSSRTRHSHKHGAQK